MLDEGEGDRETANGMLLRDNVYGTIEEDALRRDFTVNALYYNIDDFSVIDYADGLRDLESGTLRLLGDPDVRYREDPVRMLRAVRFAAKLGFVLAPECEEPLLSSGQLLDGVPAARLFDEVLKLFMGGTAVQAFEKLRHYDLFSRLFPETDEALSHQEQEFPITFVLRGLENTDQRVREGKPVTPAFLFAFLLWEPVRRHAERLAALGEPPWSAMEAAASEMITRQVQRVSIPRRFSLPMREIWLLQHRLEQRSGKRPHRLLTHPRFRAAYDFLLLRSEAGEIDPELGDWWTRFQESEGVDRERMTRGQEGQGSGRRRRGRRRRPRSKAGDG
jgi:poly(A) polymerase